MGFMSDMIVLATQDAGGGQGAGVTPGAPASAGALNTDVVCRALDCLPVERWATATISGTSREDFASRIVNLLNFTDAVGNSFGHMLNALGNGMWALAANLADGGVLGGSDKAIAVAGPAANTMAAAVYKALFDPATIGFFLAIPVLVAIVAGVVAVYMRQGAGVLARRLVCLFLALGLFYMMGATSAAHPTDAYPGTPYWLVSTAKNVVDEAGGGVTKAFNGALEKTGGLVADPSDQSNMASCRRYTSVLNQAGRKNRNAMSDGVNLMWEETGLRAWMRGSYGTGENASNVFCRILEYRAGADAQAMSDITTAGMGGVNAVQQNAIAFWPTMMSTAKDLRVQYTLKQPADSTTQMLDRWVMLWNVCKVDADGSFKSRAGFKFVGAIKRKPLAGSAAGVVSREAEGPLDSSCEAALTGIDPDGNDTYYVTRGDGDEAKPVTDDSDKTNKRSEIANLTLLFDVNTATSGWQQLVFTNGGGNMQQNTAAYRLIDQQHGKSSLGTLSEGFLNGVAGEVNLIIWGLGCGSLQTLSMLVACLAALGLFLALLLLAVSPDAGRRAVGNALVQMLAWVAGPTVVALFGSLGILFTNIGMALLGLVDADGNTQGGVLRLLVAAIFLPVLYVKAVKLLCVKVWRIGNPFSLPGLAQLAGFGNGMKRGLAMAGGAVVAAGVCVATGGSAAMALGSAGMAMKDGGRGGLAGTVMNGVKAGASPAMHGMTGGGRSAGGHGPSQADKAAIAARDAKEARERTEYLADRPTPDENRLATTRYENKVRAELAKSLQGDELESQVRKVMRSDTAAEDIGQLAEDIHEQAKAGPQPPSRPAFAQGSPQSRMRAANGPANRADASRPPAGRPGARPDAPARPLAPSRNAPLAGFGKGNKPTVNNGLDERTLMRVGERLLNDMRRRGRTNRPAAGRAATPARPIRIPVPERVPTRVLLERERARSMEERRFSRAEQRGDISDENNDANYRRFLAEQRANTARHRRGA